MTTAHKQRNGMLGALALTAISLGTSATAQSLFDGCPSQPILQRFVEFGKSGQMPPDLGQWLNTQNDQYVTPWKPFDNVDFVGVCWVSAWLVHTDDGTVLIDTLYGPFQNTLIENIKATGTDLADIKYVLMTHGHFDHAGGAAGLKPLLPNATFVMTQGGWDEAINAAAASQDGPRAWSMVAQDMVASDGLEIKLGGNTFTVLETPGHTWGTASYVYDVKDGDDSYRAITIGGLGLNAIDGPAQVEAYIASVDRMQALLSDRDGAVEVHLTTHGFSNRLDENRQTLTKRAPGTPNLFVNSNGISDQLATLRERAVNRLAIEQNK